MMLKTGCHFSTDFPPYSDTLGTREKCHFSQMVTLSEGFYKQLQSLGPVKTITVTGVSL